jgi:hypothetical protein
MSIFELDEQRQPNIWGPMASGVWRGAGQGAHALESGRGVGGIAHGLAGGVSTAAGAVSDGVETVADDLGRIGDGVGRVRAAPDNGARIVLDGGLGGLSTAVGGSFDALHRGRGVNGIASGIGSSLLAGIYQGVDAGVAGTERSASDVAAGARGVLGGARDLGEHLALPGAHRAASATRAAVRRSAARLGAGSPIASGIRAGLPGIVGGARTGVAGVGSALAESHGVGGIAAGIGSSLLAGGAQAAGGARAGANAATRRARGALAGAGGIASDLTSGVGEAARSLFGGLF